MTAKEAKELSHKNNVLTNASQLNDIIYKIREACKRGEYFIYLYEIINADVKGRLEEMGYKVHNTQFERDGEVMTQISWS